MIWLVEEDAPKTPADYDRFVSAEIPDPNSEPELFEIVKKWMLHGPCSELNPHSSCMQSKAGSKKKVCDKGFPKELAEHTTAEAENKKPIYRRRCPEKGGQTVTIRCSAMKRDVKLDNRWVVPYNKFLLRKYNCHMNVEIVCSVVGVKYITKYLTKGADK